LFNIPLELVDLEISQSCREEVDCEENPTHDHPIHHLAVVPQSIVTVLKGAALAK